MTTTKSRFSNSEISLILARTTQQEGRTCDPNEVCRQIGTMNLLAVSGGRVVAISNEENEPVGVILPMGKSRAVEVVLDWSDLYTVRRVRMVTSGANKGSFIVEDSIEGVYCDELGERVYRISCWQ